jgi:hypothetical protein
MTRMTTTLIIGTAMGVVLVLSAMMRQTAPEKESRSNPSGPLGRPAAVAPTPERAKESGVPRVGLGDESPVPASGPALAPKAGDKGPRSVLPTRDLSDLARRKALRRAEEEYWEDLGLLQEERLTVTPETHRGRVLMRTTVYLGLEPALATAFEETAARSTQEIAEAWKARNEAIVGLPEGLSADERAQKEHQIQQRYETAKEQSSSRVVAFLGTNPRHDRFRQRLGEWIDAMR